MAYEGSYTDVMTAVDTIRNNADRYTLAADFYWGRVGEVFGSAQVAKLLSSNFTNFNVNFAKRVVDAVLDRVGIASITAGDDDSLSQKLRDVVWNANKMGKESKKIHRASLIYGDSYAIAWAADELDGGGVDIQFSSPLVTRVFYEVENPKQKSFAAKVWMEGSTDHKVTRVTLFYADRIERYISKPGTKGDKLSDFDPYSEADDQGAQGEWPIPNPFGEIPVFHFRTDDPYGHPEHEPAWGAQNAITKTIATEMDVMEQEAFPQRYLLTEDPMAMVNTNASSYERVASSTVDEDDLNPKDRVTPFSAGAGKFHRFNGVKEVGQLAAAETSGFAETVDHFLRLMSSATGTPMHSLHPVGDMPSGEALRAAEAPLASRIEDREEWWEETWIELLTFASSIVGLAISNVDVQWDSVTAVDDVDGLNAFKLKRELGVPQDQVLREMGYLASTVQQWEDEGLTPMPMEQQVMPASTTVPVPGE